MKDKRTKQTNICNAYTMDPQVLHSISDMIAYLTKMNRVLLDIREEVKKVQDMPTNCAAIFAKLEILEWGQNTREIKTFLDSPTHHCVTLPPTHPYPPTPAPKTYSILSKWPATPNPKMKNPTAKSTRTGSPKI